MRLTKLAVLLILTALALAALPALAQTPTPAPTETPFRPTMVPTMTPSPTPIGMTDATEEPFGEVMDEGGTIDYGGTVTSALSPDLPAVGFTFEGEIGDQITITMTSNDFDCYLVLLDPTGFELFTDDDSAGDLDSRIGPITLSSAGTYTIVAQSYSYRNGGGTDVSGSFVLTVAEFEAAPIEYTQEIEGELNDAVPTAFFRFTGQEGDAVLIRMESDDFDSYLTLNDPDGFEIAFNDDGAGNLNALIGPFVLPITGEYIINARSLSGRDVGNFTLRVDRAQVTDMSYGDSVEVTFTEVDRLFYFSFDAAAGDVVTIGASSDGALDTRLQLNDAFNYMIASDEDSGSGFDPEIYNYVLSFGDTYMVLLEAPFGGEGAVTVTLSRSELPRLDEGTQFLSFSANRTTTSAVFDGVAGETVTVTLETMSGVASPSVDAVQSGMSLAYVSGSSVSRVSFTFETFYDDDVVLTFNEYSYTDIGIRVTLERE
jgi:hypothetical protein